VADASDSSIESRYAALESLQDLGRADSGVAGLLIYVPAARPLTNEARQRDPFAIYEACGAVFPEGDGDEYLNLCLRAKPDYTTEVRKIFADNPNPAFAVVDAIGGGGGWPSLQALLHVESVRDILFALLAPSDAQRDALKAEVGWLSEAKDLLHASLGLRLMTKGKTWSPLAEELWRFVLFSEFVLDLREALPASLADVPRAPPEARLLVIDLCDRLRNDRRTQALYIDKATAVERELELPARCQPIADLGARDTFPFEERSFLAHAVDAVLRDNLDKVRKILAEHGHSVWLGTGESQAQWQVVRSAVELVEACGDADRQLPNHARDQADLIGYYVTSLCEVDRLQREFEQAVGDYIDPAGPVGDVLAHVRGRYRKLAAKAQEIFVKHLEKSGWPPTGMLANADVFDKLIGPKLTESGRRVAYLMVDALRYELGVALEKQLAEDATTELQPAFASLPTGTPVGMASLLPGAGQILRLNRKDGGMVPALGDVIVSTVTQRMDVLSSRFGQRFAEATLGAFVKGKAKVPETVDLLVIRSTEIDSHLESNPDTALEVVQNMLKRIRVAVHKLSGLGFQDVVIATDHGFVLNPDPQPGDGCAKPPGNWIAVHDRAVLGTGTPDSSNFVVPAGHAGVRGDFTHVGGPRGLVAYRTGETYMHGGASLQEAVVPVLALRLGAAPGAGKAAPKVVLGYKRGTKRITTRLPVVEIAVDGGLFSDGIEVLLEAHDKKGDVVGEAKAGGPVNPATRTLTVKPGEPAQVAIKMNAEFEGKFTLKALDPATLAVHSKLDLETDYTV
jgi:hypothetical protein